MKLYRTKDKKYAFGIFWRCSNHNCSIKFSIYHGSPITKKLDIKTFYMLVHLFSQSIFLIIQKIYIFFRNFRDTDNIMWILRNCARKIAKSTALKYFAVFRKMISFFLSERVSTFHWASWTSRIGWNFHWISKKRSDRQDSWQTWNCVWWGIKFINQLIFIRDQV